MMVMVVMMVLVEVVVMMLTTPSGRGSVMWRGNSKNKLNKRARLATFVQLFTHNKRMNLTQSE
jgi:hypothetical protein